MSGRSYYYEVWVSSPKYHQDKALTYGFDQTLERGSVVVVPLRKSQVPAVILKKVAKPDFKTKDMLRTISAAPLPKQLLELIAWMKDYYPAPLGQLLPLILPTALVKEGRKPEKDFGATDSKPDVLPPLTHEQAEAITAFNHSNSQSVLLHGDTGTGKTRVYLELIREALAANKSAVLLTPEIGLTPQLAKICAAAFPGQTIIMHSDLTPSHRRDAWKRILAASVPLVVMGARSALFTPLKQIGLIIVDEFHETTYKQEQTPYYLTSRVAAALTNLHGAKLVLGSATPPVNDYYAFQEKNLPILRMQKLAVRNSQPVSAPQIIDLKKRHLFNRSSWLSDQLLESIEVARSQGEQSLLFLNRRGTARLVMCASCGWQATCPRCDLPLTYHGDKHFMQCHTCGFIDKTPTNCQNCGAYDIIFRAIGTKFLETELKQLFPDATIKRFDSDTLKQDRLERQYTDIRDGKIDILVGTQMLGKGLDLPKLSVLGVVLGDTSLSFPDYTAEERTFQLLTQVIGRVQRGHRAGSVFIQTYYPDNPVLRAALDKDYESFYEQQLAERRLYAFPPFRFLLKLTCTYARQSNAQKAAQKLADQLRQSSFAIEVVGPSPAFTEKIHDRYQWQLVIKAVRRSELTRLIAELPPNWSYDIDPLNLL